MAGGGGGAWKVAYADFVTAMMALFMVLWISAQDQEILIATSRYFQQPFNSPMDASTGVLSMSSGSGTGMDSVNESEASSMTDLALLNKLAQDFYKLLDIDETSREAPVSVEVTNDGLRVTMFNRHGRPLFVDETSGFTEWGRFVVQNLAWLVERNEFKLRIDGHTATGFVPDSPDYTSWELSADRANATRRELQFYAVRAERFERVTGFSDTVPISGRPAEDPANDRIELSLVVLPPIRPSGT